MTMNRLYRVQWRMLMDLRHSFHFLAERFPRIAPWAIFIRFASHVITGNPVVLSTAILAMSTWWLNVPLRLVTAIALPVVVAYEVTHRALFEAGHGGTLVGWREAWRLHRRWPYEWARAAAKTTRVQAEVGTSKEPMASARLRPVADHPKMGWWPTIEWPQVSWWVGPPPGRSFEKFAEVLDVLAANYSRCVSMDLEYERSTDSFGRLIVSFGSVLDKTIEPVETAVDAVRWQPTVAADPEADVDGFRPWTPTVVEGDAA